MNLDKSLYLMILGERVVFIRKAKFKSKIIIDNGWIR